MEMQLPMNFPFLPVQRGNVKDAQGEKTIGVDIPCAKQNYLLFTGVSTVIGLPHESKLLQKRQFISTVTLKPTLP